MAAGGAHHAALSARGLAAAHARPPHSTRGRSFSYHGRTQASFLVGRYGWPGGYFYRPYFVGGYLPAVFWRPDYFILDYDYYGLAPPPPDYEWIRYGPDMLLIELETGRIIERISGAFDEGGASAFYGNDPEEMAGDPPPPR